MNKKTFEEIKAFTEENDISVREYYGDLSFEWNSSLGENLVWDMKGDEINSFADFAEKLGDVLPIREPYDHVLFVMGGGYDGASLEEAYNRAEEINNNLDGLYDDSFKDGIACMDDVRKIVEDNGLWCDVADGRVELTTEYGDTLHSFDLTYDEDGVIDVQEVLKELRTAQFNFDKTDFCYDQLGLSQDDAMCGYSVEALLEDAEDINKVMGEFKDAAERKAETLTKDKDKNKEKER